MASGGSLPPVTSREEPLRINQDRERGITFLRGTLDLFLGFKGTVVNGTCYYITGGPKGHVKLCL